MLARGAVLAILALAAPVLADEPAEPAEMPPAGYAGQQYVDSKGCLFLRAGRVGEVLWVPRVTREGVPLCGNPTSGQRVPVADTGEVAPDQADATLAASDGGEPGWYVAVGSFGQTSNVDRAVERLRVLGYPATQGRATGTVGLQTVFAGPLPSAKAAEDAQSKLRGQGFPDATVIRRQD